MSRAVGSDQGLATLYTTLVLATPGAHLSPRTKVDSSLFLIYSLNFVPCFRNFSSPSFICFPLPSD